MPLTMDQLRVKPMDVLMGRTRYDKMRYVTIGFGGAFVALLVVILAMVGAMAFAAKAAGAEFQWGFFVPNKATWCQGVKPAPASTPVTAEDAYTLLSPTGGGVTPTLYMSSDRGRDAVGTPSLPDVGHPAGSTSTRTQLERTGVALGLAGALGTLLFLLGSGLVATAGTIFTAAFAAWGILLGVLLHRRLGAMIAVVVLAIIAAPAAALAGAVIGGWIAIRSRWARPPHGR